MGMPFQVLVEIVGRKKLVTVAPSDGENRVSAFKAAFNNMCHSDEHLHAVISQPNTYPVYQIYNSDFDEMVELEESDNLLPKTRVSVEMIVNNYNVVNHGNNFSHDNTLNGNESTVPCIDSLPGDSSIKTENLSSTDSQELHFPPKSHSDMFPFVSLPIEPPMNPTLLPHFSPKLQAKLNDGNFAKTDYNRFIRECGAFLLTVYPEPTKQTYRDFCATILTAYPQIQGRNPIKFCNFFKRKLTCHIRNVRYRDRLKDRMNQQSQQHMDLN